MKKLFFIFFLSFASCALPYNYDFAKDDFDGTVPEPVPPTPLSCEADQHQILNDEGVCVCEEEYTDLDGVCVESVTEGSAQELCEKRENVVWNSQTGECPCTTGYNLVEGFCLLKVNENQELIPDIDVKCVEGYVLDGSICIIDGEAMVSCDSYSIPVGDVCVCPSPNIPNGDDCELPPVFDTWDLVSHREPLGPVKDQKLYTDPNSIDRTTCSSIYVNTDVNDYYKVQCISTSGVQYISSNYNFTNILDSFFDYENGIFKIALLIKEVGNYYFLKVYKSGISDPISSTSIFGLEGALSVKIQRDLSKSFSELTGSDYFLSVKSPSSISVFKNAWINLLQFSAISDFGVANFSDNFYYFYKLDDDYFFNKVQIGNGISYNPADLGQVLAFDLIFKNGADVISRYLVDDGFDYYVKEFNTQNINVISLLKISGRGLIFKKIKYSKIDYDDGAKSLKVLVAVVEEAGQNKLKIFYYDGTSVGSPHTSSLFNLNFPESVNLEKINLLNLLIINKDKFVVSYPGATSVPNVMIDLTFNRR